MATGREWPFSGDPLHTSVESYLSQQLQELNFACSKLMEVEQHIQRLMQDREHILYEIEIRQANVQQAQQKMNNCRESTRDRWLDIRKRYNLTGGDPLSLISLLPVELLVCIFKFLPPKNICTTMQVSKFWSEVSSSDVVWNCVYKTSWGKVDEHICDVCRDLVEVEKGPKGGEQSKHGQDPMSDEMEVESTKRTPWRNVFAHRHQIEKNWKTGRYSAHTFTGHTDWVTCISVYQNIMISGSWDTLIKVWNLETKECLTTLCGHSAGINDLDVSADGSVFVSGSSDCSLRIWSMQTHECMNVLEGHTDQVSFTKFSYNPPCIVSGSLDGTVRLWNVSQGKCISTLEGHASGITAMCVFDGCAITGANDGVIIVWDIAKCRSRANLTGHTDRITSMHLDAETKRLASGSWDFTVKIWDLVTGACLRTLTGHIFRVKCVDFRGDTVVSGGWDNEAKVWDVTTGECKQTFSGHSSYIWATQLLSRQKRLITGSWDCTVRMFDLESGKCMYSLDHTSEVLCMESNSHRLIGASKDIRLWDFSAPS